MTESRKRTLLIATIALSLLPSLLLLQFPGVVTVQTIALWASAVLGYAGIVMLLWMYILGAKSVMGTIFKDLAPVLTIHKWLGKYGTVAIFLHPLFITVSYSESLLYSVIPKLSTVSERHILLGQIALWLLVTVWVTSALVRDRLSWRTWRYLHWLAYITIPFALLHVPDLGSQEQIHIMVKAYFFSLVLVYTGVSLLRLRSFLNLDRRAYTVVRLVQLTDLDYLIKLQPSGTSLSTPYMGQYIYLKLGLISEDHPFSVTQYSSATGEITLAFRQAGMYTRELEKLAPGETVYASGPYGSFTSDLGADDDSPVVYLAGGIGVTPFVDRIMNESSAREQWLFAANRNPDLAVLYTPLKQQLGDRAIAVFNEAEGTLQPGEESGYISPELLTRYLGDPTRYRYYICGPTPMMKAARAAVLSLDVPSSRIQQEKFGW